MGKTFIFTVTEPIQESPNRADFDELRLLTVPDLNDFNGPAQNYESGGRSSNLFGRPILVI
jgi:hypothetical protein